MLTLYRDSGTADDAFSWDVCGAESNVALYCAALGLSSAWVSRLDTGMAGSLVLDAIAAGGVDTSLVDLCDDAPTGLMLRDSSERGRRVQYYRRRSAASLMSPETVPVEACLDAEAVHLTGITMALSGGCRELVMTLLSEPAGALRSFDLNWRPALWPEGPPGELFLGAGDAFAAGFLCGYLSNPDDLQRCQRLGHVVAMSAMTSESDVGPLPDAAAIDAMLAVDAPVWGELVYPGPARG